MGVSGLRHAPGAFYPRERNPGTHWIGGWASDMVWIQRREEHSFASSGDRTPVVQSVVRLTVLLQLHNDPVS
jgi:hypothetical protein